LRVKIQKGSMPKEKTYKYAMKLITRILMKIHKLNAPQKYEKERKLEKNYSIKKNHYMQ
jgi:hypothetical protein